LPGIVKGIAWQAEKNPASERSRILGAEREGFDIYIYKFAIT
jgi:hypothetical protein